MGRTEEQKAKHREYMRAYYHSRPEYKKSVIERSSQWARDNPEKANARSKKWADANKDRRAETTRAWQQKNKTRLARNAAEWRKKNPDKNLAAWQGYDMRHPGRKAEQMRQWRAANPERSKETGKRSRDKLKQEAIEAYGGVCKCCGESNRFFLTLDHINNDGHEHRKRLGSSKQIYTHLRREGWPDYVRLLCFNCNLGRAINGGTCPHQSERLTALVAV